MSFPTASTSSDSTNASLRLLFVAKCEERKGLDILLSALGDLEPRAWRLSIVGEGWSEAPRVLDQLTRLESQNVDFLGRINNADLCAVMHHHDLLVVPSIYENFGNVSIEAQVAGLPVLVSRTGGLKDTIIEGETGFSFIAGDRRDLLQTLTKIVALERSELQKMGSAAAKRAREFYDWAHVASAYETTFRIVISTSSK